jgi:hypothetical protein
MSKISIWQEICDQRRCDEPEVLSPPDDIPAPKTDLVEPLGELESCQEGLKCMKCNGEGRVLLMEKRSPGRAYVEFQKGMLGTGESAYSELLTNYFNECLDIFSQRMELSDGVEKFRFYVNEIRKRVFWPKYEFLKLALEKIVWEAKERGDLATAVGVQKRLIFIIMLEGRGGEGIEASQRRDFFLTHEQEISNAMERLSTLLAAGTESDGK